jgi:hypothetical protein
VVASLAKRVIDMAADEKPGSRVAGPIAGRRRAVLAGSLWALVAVAGSAAWGWQAVAAGEPWWHTAVIAVVLVVPATVATALTARLPGNPVGWLLLASTAATAVAGSGGGWAIATRARLRRRGRLGCCGRWVRRVATAVDSRWPGTTAYI